MERQASQILGDHWDSGHALLVYEHHQRDDILATDREYSSQSLGPTSLMPQAERDSLVLVGKQTVGLGLTAFADLYYTDKKSDVLSFDGFFFDAIESHSDVEQYGGTAGLRRGLGTSWQAELAATYGLNEVALRSRSPLHPDFFNGTAFYDNDLWSVDAKLDGDGWNLPAGAVRLAIGAGYRQENIDIAAAGPSGQLFRFPHNDRTVSYAFGELLVPIFASANARPGLRVLELSLAGRYEDYDDFGTTFNPKYSLRWSPMAGLTWRGTYGTSFKAPTLNEINGFSESTFIFDLDDDLTPGGLAHTLWLAGNNPDLTEETSSSWTLGFDLAPELLGGLNLHVTYFQTEYEDRIATLSFLRLDDPVLVGTVLRRGDIPDAEFDAQVAALLANPPAAGISGCSQPLNGDGSCPDSAASFDAILDNRALNLSDTLANGVDVGAGYGFKTALGEFQLDANIGYYFNFKNRTTSAQPLRDDVDTPRHVPDMRGRLSVSWSGGRGFGATAAVNYTDRYLDNLASPSVGVDAYTTVDVGLSYDTRGEAGRGWLDNLLVLLNAQNLFDEDPPFFGSNAFTQTGYDHSNADPLGRFVTLQIRKAF